MSYKEKLNKQIAEIPKEKKQEILDLFWNNFSVGKIGKELNLDIIVVAGVIVENIDEINILRQQVR